MDILRDAQWIYGNPEISSPIFKTVFQCEQTVVRAQLICTGLGYFEAYINGQKVSEDILVPAQTDYEPRSLDTLLYPMNMENQHRVMVLSYDVTHLLQPDVNTWGFWLGNGFYRQDQRTAEGNLVYGIPNAIGCLQLTYNDGTVHNITTEQVNWYYTSSFITFNNLFYGETHDDRLRFDYWDTQLPSDKWHPVHVSTAENNEFHIQDCPTDRLQESYTPQCVYHQGQRTIYDVGRNISAWLSFHAQGKPSDVITVRFAGKLHDDYSLDFESCGGEKQIQSFTAILGPDGEGAFSHRFTWAAFRYVEINTSAHIDDVKATFAASNIQPNSTFSCSNTLFNNLFDLYIHTQRCNLHGGITSDCPHRERLSYTGDGQLVTEPLLLHFDSASFIRKWMDDLRYGQNIHTGHVPHTVPFMGGGGGPAWGCAIIIVPWLYYQYTGDIASLQTMYPHMVHWMEYLQSRTDGDLIIHREEPDGWCLGDWCAPGETVIPEEYVNTCVYAYVAQRMDEIQRILGENNLYYQELHHSICHAINTKWYNEEDHSYSIGRQGTEALALWADIVDANHRQHVTDRMAHHIIMDCDEHLDTGIIGTPALLDTLSRYGYHELAYTIMNQTTYPSFGYMLDRGATTLWERFEEKESDNHPMFGTYTVWFIRHVMGLSLDVYTPGYEKIIIRPKVYHDLSHAEASVQTPSGKRIHLEWNMTGNEMHYRIVTPHDIEVDFQAPNGYQIKEKIQQTNTISFILSK